MRWRLGCGHRQSVRLSIVSCDEARCPRGGRLVLARTVMPELLAEQVSTVFTLGGSLIPGSRRGTGAAA